ncbi:related to ELF1 Protein required for growth on glycerol mediumTranscription elongation factor, implicated in the maintenance of proper chromatin structure [Phialocephala subalpina]|uniref:Transcription elongation factor 1 homolog n=1 Tax=Phialocephala subalpina TaxID=576137 RepID=A0A1L7X254_9HELO|nr:related to ELF1 Protein required for growth on glycerol mediumTranscription elongation factor, implicated in the maintenance of proper chromatin structure [Phialocephala subalpina]
MGKRKKAAKKPTGPKKHAQNEPLPSVFPCLFCNHEKSVSVKLDKKAGVGQLSCKVCNQQFQCAVNYLSAAVDVYSDWVDACDAVAKEDGEERAGDIAPSRIPTGRPKVRDRSEEEDDIIDDGSDGMGGYGGEGVVADDEY